MVHDFTILGSQIHSKEGENLTSRDENYSVTVIKEHLALESNKTTIS